MGAMSRNKGKTGELEAVKFLKAHGFPEARRGQQFKGSPDSPDVAGVEGFHIEVKRTERFDLYGALAQAKADAGPASTPVVMHRRNGHGWVFVIGGEDFMKLLDELFETGE